MSTSETVSPSLIDEALSFDSLAVAEELTGSSYKDNPETASLGFLLQLNHSAAKRAILQENQDTYFGMSVEEAVAIVEDMGFQLLSSGKCGDSEDQWFIYWKEGILVFFDTFWGSLNSGHAYFNFLQSEYKSIPEFSGGHFKLDESSDSYVAYGSIDIREGFRHRITQMQKQGTFLKEWKEQPFLWLVNHEDTKVQGYSHESINSERISILPVEVQQAISSV